MMSEIVAQLALNGPIRTSRLHIRRFEPKDLPPFQEFMKDSASTRFLPFPEEMRTSEGARELIEETIRRYARPEPLLAYAVERWADGSFVGFCGMNLSDDDGVEILCAIMPAFRRQGFAKEVAQALCQHIFVTSSVPAVVAFVDPQNAPSLAALRTLGFGDHGLEVHPSFREPVRRLVLKREAFLCDA